MTKVWVVRSDNREYAETFRKGGFAGIGWENIGDLTEVTQAAQLATRYDQHADPAESERTRSISVNTIWRFVSKIAIGDWIITPQKEKRHLLHYGRVTGDYRWVDLPDDECPYQHRKDVEWSQNTLDRGSLSVPFQRTLGSTLTVFNVRHLSEFLSRIGQPIADSGGSQTPGKSLKPYELAIERILTLSPTAFEELVGHLLGAIGFEIEVTQPTKDGGVDFHGTLNVSSAAEVNILGQVKRYQRSSRINDKPIQDLRGRIPIGGQGTFVTTSDYTKKAREIAEAENFPRVGLINGEQLIDLLTQHWLDIPDDFRDELALKLILVPA